MKKNLILAAFASSLLLVSCGEGNQAAKEEKKVSQPEKTSVTCNYSYNHETSKLKWTAYKTTDKIGVSGTFNNIEVSGTTTSETPVDVLKNLTFNIPIASVNTSNEDRDGKIAKHFFGTMTGTENISGMVTSMEADGKCTIGIKMNDTEKEVAATYTIEGQAVTVNAVIDLNDWNGADAVKALNEVCNDLHKGADGVSKLWPEVKLEITTTLNKDCN